MTGNAGISQIARKVFVEQEALHATGWSEK